MKNSKNILIFFIVLFILFWNPASFYLFYRSSEIYGSIVFKSVFYALPCIGIILIFFIKKKKTISSRSQNTIFSVSFFGIFFAFLVTLNAFAGFILLGKTKRNEGLIFPPNTIARYKTVEFDYKAVINSLGLRNKEISIEKKKGTFRILCFGDSFT